MTQIFYIKHNSLQECKEFDKIIYDSIVEKDGHFLFPFQEGTTCYTECKPSIDNPSEFVCQIDTKIIELSATIPSLEQALVDKKTEEEAINLGWIPAPQIYQI